MYRPTTPGRIANLATSKGEWRDMAFSEVMRFRMYYKGLPGSFPPDTYARIPNQHLPARLTDAYRLLIPHTIGFYCLANWHDFRWKIRDEFGMFDEQGAMTGDPDMNGHDTEDSDGDSDDGTASTTTDFGDDSDGESVDDPPANDWA